MKEIKDLTIADDFMFCYIMTHYLDICSSVIECILGMKIRRLKSLSQQKKQKEFFKSKAVIFDVFADDGRIFEIELQNLPKGNILKRQRLYQAAIDMGQLRKGKTYEEMKDTYIIFICNFDIFGEDIPIYQIERVLKHNKKPVENGTHEIYLNTKAADKAKNLEIAALLKYIRTKEATTELTRKIDSAVEKQKEREEFKEEYMSLTMLQMDAKIEGRAEGYAKAQAVIAQKDACISQMAQEIKRLKETQKMKKGE